jgi:hypothetical protein
VEIGYAVAGLAAFEVLHPRLFSEMNSSSGTAMLQSPTALVVTFLVPIGFVLLAVLAPRWSECVFRRFESVLAMLAKRRTLTIWFLFFFVIGFRLALLPLLPVPVPGIHDEFSYLLMADTFVHGRLANPPHPMWISFETFHVNWFPTYSSMYPPGQGMVLALGQWLGHPWIGVLLSVGAMCAAILWMLEAWLPARWALLGAVLAVIKFGTVSYWINSYWGGAVAAGGGALVLGAMPRIARHARPRDALLLGFGLAILANSRPYEGLLFCIPVACWFLWWLAGRTKSLLTLRERMSRVFVPLAAVLALTIAFIGYYNWRLTGHALLFPHVLNTRTYQSVGLFLWQHPREPLQYRNEQFEDFHNGWEREEYDNTWRGVLKVTADKLTRCGTTYFWWGAILALPGLPFVFFDRKMRLPLVTFLLGAAGSLAVIWAMPHYAAPLTCVMFLLLVQAIRHLRTMRLAGRPLGLALCGALVYLLIADVSSSVSDHVCDQLIWTCQGDPSRAAIAEELFRSPGKHLVMVRYGEDHNIHDEWVYNGADIDGAKVLWARDISPEQNAKLFAYFKDRHIWLVMPDTDNSRLEPYSSPPSSPKE